MNLNFTNARGKFRAQPPKTAMVPYNNNITREVCEQIYTLLLLLSYRYDV